MDPLRFFSVPEVDEPDWAASELYPAKPAESAYGALSRKGRSAEFQTEEALAEHVRGSRESVVAVWTGETERMVPPEAVPGLLEPLRRRFLDLAEADAADARRNTVVFGILLLWALYAAAARRVPPQDSVTVGIAAVLLLILGLIPLYEAWKATRQAWQLGEEDLREEEREARFDYWLDQQRCTITYVLLGFLVVAGAVQLWVDVPGQAVPASVVAAGLVREAYQSGEWWRLLTAPFVHGHPLHWVLNALGLYYLGKRVEALAGWSHLGLVFLFAMVTGGWASVRFAPAAISVGASGGLLGLLGFLLLFEFLHPRLVPRSARRRLLAGLLVCFAVGLVGYAFIDNYAHAGGLAAGMLYALIAFPPSRSARCPRMGSLDRLVGGAALAVLAVSLLLAVGRMLAT